MKEVVSFLVRVGKLKRMPRMGWLTVGIPLGIVENVAEHSMRVNYSALLLGMLAKKRGLEIDEAKLLKMATIHDLPETTFMDVGGEARNIIGRENRVEYEREGLKLAVNELPDDIKKELIGLWEEYEKRKTLEAKIVWLADKIEMFLQALEYMKLGVRKNVLSEFVEELNNVLEKVKSDGDLKEFKSILESILEEIDHT